MNVPVERCTIFLTLAGSQAHGTAREGSDVDLRGVCIAPLTHRLSLFSQFEHYEGSLGGPLGAIVQEKLAAHASASLGLAIKTECVVFDVAKFIGLCAAANPNALELLFAHEHDWIFETPAWRKLHSQRQRFLTKKIQQTFLGYAMAQLKKIKTHRSWLLAPPLQKPSRVSLGLPGAESTLGRDDQNRIERSIAEKIRSYGIDDIEMPKATRLAVEEKLGGFVREVLSTPEDDLEARIRAVASHALKVPPEVIVALNAERKYRAAMNHWESYQTWKSQRNRARADLEGKHGYDTKHAMHLVRLMRMGVEVLEQGELLVRRSDAAELNAIRDGAMTFDELLELSTQLHESLARATSTSTLPDDLDHGWVNDLAFDLMTEQAR